MSTNKIKIYCNVCMGEKNHTVLYTKDQRYEEPDGEDGRPGYYERSDYTLAECAGCEHITLVIDTFSSDVPENQVTQYPPRTIRKEPKWLFDLFLGEAFSNPVKYDFIQEIYIALRNNTPRLAVIGIRALLEQIMIEKVGDNKSFERNLAKFEEMGFISSVQRKSIEPVIEAGHASTHRGFKAKSDEVIYLMDVTENLIESIYINQERASRINVPPRKT